MDQSGFAVAWQAGYHLAISRPHSRPADNPAMTRCHALFIALLAVGPALAADNESGYHPLFDGQSLAGWEGAGQPAEKCWKAEGGTILCTGEKGPWLRSKEQVDDFNL